ncbi:MAG: dihydroneopterin aldolase, partial [Clostridia bacterium]|nr:dihydroneopterin aldolase [Clostridia bacterium]
MKGTIILKDYEVVACHGVNPEEKVNPQRFLFTVKVDTDFALSASSDNLANTVSYSAVKKVVKAVAEENSFDLIETLAYTVAKCILLAFPLADGVSDKVKKPDAPMSGNFDYVGVELALKWHEAYLALGSNEGDRNAYLDLAIKMLNEDDNFKEVVESKRIETEAYGGVATGEFVNSCVKAKTL